MKAKEITPRKILGGVLASSPLIALFVISLIEAGVLRTLAVFGVAAVVIVVAVIGVNLMFDGR